MSFAMKKWDGGLPPMYITQLMTYMKVCGVDYGEFALLKDGRFFEIFPIAKSDTLIDKIVNITGEFWDKVVQGKEIVNSGIPFEDMREALAHLEPEPDESNAYEGYLKDRYVNYVDENSETKVQSNDEVVDAVGKYWVAHKEAKEWSDKKKGAGNIIRNFMDINNAQEIALPGNKLIKNYGKLIVPKI